MGEMQLSDEELIAAGRTDELFERYTSRVAAWCFRFSGDREQARDLAQDILLRAFRNLHLFRRESRFSTWLFTIARNHCMNEIKSQSIRLEDRGEDELLENTESGQPDVLSRLVEEQSIAEMRAMIEESLDATEKHVLTLHYHQDLPLAVVTRLLGLTNASGARAYIASAKRKLSAAAPQWMATQKRQNRSGKDAAV